MNRAEIPYSVGGALALHWYSGYWRAAKDLDLFIPPEHIDAAMRVLDDLGFATSRKHPEWLAEGILQHHKVDLIYGMGNWMAYVDQAYLDYARSATVVGVCTQLVPPEEMIFSKAFVASRERNDSADVFHMLLATASLLDWERLLQRFGEHWEVLLSILILCRYVYPSHRDEIPGHVLDELLARFQRTRREPWTGGKICRGLLLDGNGTYSLAVGEWGYRDARQDIWDELQRRRPATKPRARDHRASGPDIVAEAGGTEPTLAAELL